MQGNSDALNSPKKSQLKEYHTEFYKLCYQQYVQEIERADKFHQKTGNGLQQ